MLKHAMAELIYLKFDEIDPGDFLEVLNNQRVRQHLMAHEPFTLETLTLWMNDKIAVDSIPGCKVRGIAYHSEIVGWCGIQYENGKYEIAIIINDKHWGLGKRIFMDVMAWAKELGHAEVTINFLHSRPEYKFLKRIANAVYEVEILGNKFMCYQLPVG